MIHWSSASAAGQKQTASKSSYFRQRGQVKEPHGDDPAAVNTYRSIAPTLSSIYG